MLFNDLERGEEPFRAEGVRVLDREIGPLDLIPQGGGDPRTGHRCPGELITIALLGAFARRLARLDYYLPPQDLTINLSRIPAKPADGVPIVVPWAQLSASRSPRSGGS